MRNILLIAIVLFSASIGKCNDRYEAKCFDCYLVGLCGVFEGDKMVSQPYGTGAFNDLQKMADKWNRRGQQINDERKMQQSLRRKSLEMSVVGRKI